MSKLSNDKKYLNLDSVRVSYQHKSDSITLTSNDQDLRNTPFKLSLNKGTESESLLRELLFEKGLIRNDENNKSIRTRVKGTIDSRTPHNQIPIGITHGDEPVFWEVDKSSHLIISAAESKDTGKISASRSIFNHCISHNNKWEVYIHDPNNVHSDLHDKLLNTVKNVSQDLLELFYLVSSIQSEIKTRYELISNENVDNASKLKTSPKSILFFIEGLHSLVLSPEDTTKNKEANDFANDFIKKETVKRLAEILDYGREANVHVVFSCYNIEKSMPHKIFSRFANFLLLSDYSKPTIEKITGTTNSTSFDSKIKGRGVFVDNSSEVKELEVQTYKVSPSAIDFWILNHGKKNEPKFYEELSLSSLFNKS